MYENLILDVSERIATVTINRPKMLNALNSATMRELDAVLSEIAGRQDAGVVPLHLALIECLALAYYLFAFGRIESLFDIGQALSFSLFPGFAQRTVRFHGQADTMWIVEQLCLYKLLDEIRVTNLFT